MTKILLTTLLLAAFVAADSAEDPCYTFCQLFDNCKKSKSQSFCQSSLFPRSRSCFGFYKKKTGGYCFREACDTTHVVPLRCSEAKASISR